MSLHPVMVGVGKEMTLFSQQSDLLSLSHLLALAYTVWQALSAPTHILCKLFLVLAQFPRAAVFHFALCTIDAHTGCGSPRHCLRLGWRQPERTTPLGQPPLLLSVALHSGTVASMPAGEGSVSLGL